MLESTTAQEYEEFLNRAIRKLELQCEERESRKGRKKEGPRKEQPTEESRTKEEPTDGFTPQNIKTSVANISHDVGAFVDKTTMWKSWSEKSMMERVGYAEHNKNRLAYLRHWVADAELLRGARGVCAGLVLGKVQRPQDYYKNCFRRLMLIRSVLVLYPAKERNDQGSIDQDLIPPGEEAGTALYHGQDAEDTSLPDAQGPALGSKHPLTETGTEEHSGKRSCREPEQTTDQERGTSDRQDGTSVWHFDTNYPANFTNFEDHYAPWGNCQGDTLTTTLVPGASEVGEIHRWNSFHAIKFLSATVGYGQLMPTRTDDFYNYFDVPLGSPFLIQQLLLEMPRMRNLVAKRGAQVIKKNLIVGLPIMEEGYDSFLFVLTSYRSE